MRICLLYCLYLFSNFLTIVPERALCQAPEITTPALRISILGDTTLPKIHDVTITSVTSTGATIVWQTDERADSQVEYGFTKAYGALSPLDTTLVTYHLLSLAGLVPNSIYHFRIRSKDGAGNLAVSEDFTFTTRAVRMLFADNFTNSVLDTSKWRLGSNWGNRSAVTNQALELRSQGSESGWVLTRHAYPARNTTITVKVVKSNDDGDLGMSPTYSASSPYGIYDQANWYRFATYRQSMSGPYHLYVYWKKNGVEKSFEVTGNLVINETVYLRLRFDNTNIHFEASLDGTTWTDTYTEAFALPGYTLDAPFYYELAAFNTESNGVLLVDDFSIADHDAPPDVEAPQISKIAASNVTAEYATITWETNEWSDSQVEYGLDISYGRASAWDTSLVKNHGVLLTGLQANTIYHFRVKSRDAAGNLAAGEDQTFKTNASAALAFSDITLAAGTGGPASYYETGGHAAIFADVDNDTRPDLYITMYNVIESPTADLFFRNTGGNLFAEEAARRGIDDYDGGSHGACFADLDNDGDYDLFNGTTRGTTGVPGINNIYRNDGTGFFTDVTAASGLPIREWETRSVIAFDMDRDGDLDLFSVTDYLGTNDPPGDRNEVYRNEGNLHFTSIDSGALFEARAGQGSTDTDFDGDGDIDIITANRTGPVNILRNDGNGNFTLIPPLVIGITHKAGDGISMADVDNDGDLDMLLTSGNEGHLYLNNGGGTFRFQQSFSNTTGYMGGFADLDNDGDVDLVFAGDEVCYLNNGAGIFVAALPIPVKNLNDPRAISFADIDHDGDLDFAMGCKRSRNWLIRNDFNSGNWLKIRLISPQGQAGAFGAKTRIYPPGQAGGTLIGLRESRSNNGYLGQDDPVLHFGLGTLTSVDVVAAFLDGSTVIRRNVAARQTITINGAEAPRISNVRVDSIAANRALIQWNTDKPAYSKVDFGTDMTYGMVCADSTLQTHHGLWLTGLADSTRYYFRVRSIDAFGNGASPRDGAFTTMRDRQPPVIFNVSVQQVMSNFAVVAWQTDEPADSQVEFGLGSTYGRFTTLRRELTTFHTEILPNLLPYTTYHFRVHSRDARGNVAFSGDFVFTTLPTIDRLVMVGGDAQIGKPGKLLAVPLTVKVLNTAGIAMPNVKVAFRVISGGGKIISADTCNGAECVVATGSDGTAAVQWQVGKADSQKVEARVMERPDLMVRFTAQIDFTSVTEDADDTVPTTFALRQYPNPFRDFTRFEVALPAPGWISLKIYDLQGREVKTLAEGTKAAGRFFVTWNGRDRANEAIASGVYLVALRYEVGGEGSAGKNLPNLIEKLPVLYLK
ncbi:MAG: FG-GAP-like repeat-containing protein [candidate division KSB1 bacterium]|nr:FG-GAP-like repeat-containing protein [candidate division KSB1 bacterium]MDZ7302023.1 FG-GAP-like repeat-containing protein [candidate division KSB1 bacterium]MDZ7310205.1 FG-GAP-like repeat-containing protein [candidate division KSB1 bacterium]